MLHSVEDTIKWIRANDLQYFEVKSREQDNSLIFVANENDSQETSITRFREIMALSQGGRYFIYGTQKGEKSKRGNFREEFSSLVQSPAYSVSGVPAVSAAIPDGYIPHSEMVHELEKFKMEIEIRDLKKELSMKENSMDVFFNRLEPYAPALIGMLTKQPVPVTIGRLDAPIPEAQPEISGTVEEFLTEEQEERLNNSLTAWSGADEDWLELIEKIARLAATQNPMYATAKSILLNQ